MADQKGTTKKSSRHPLGATPDAEGVNFSIFSYDAKGVELLLFDKPKDLEHPRNPARSGREHDVLLLAHLCERPATRRALRLPS